jgi:hypothetical protein
MNRIDDNYPQFISMDEEKKKKYLDPLTVLPGSLFNKREDGDVYMMAVALGLENKKREPSKKTYGVRTYYKLEDEYKLFLRTVVLIGSDYDYDILLEGAKTLKIIEEYANGGITILHDKIMNSGLDFSIEEEVWKEVRLFSKLE